MEAPPKSNDGRDNLRSSGTCGNGRPHSGSRWFADTEEVTGSNPVAPTTHQRRSGRVFTPGLLQQESVTGSSGSKRAATANSRWPDRALRAQPIRRSAERLPPSAGRRHAVARSGRLKLGPASWRIAWLRPGSDADLRLLRTDTDRWCP